MTLEIPHLKKFKSKPKIWFENIKLCESELDLNILIKQHEIYSYLYEIYPNQKLTMIFDWLIFFKSNSISIDPIELCNSYGFYWNDVTDKLFSEYLNWPESFKKWCEFKGAHINDLRPLILGIKISAEDKRILNDFLSLFQTRSESIKHETLNEENKDSCRGINPSLSDGKKLIELFIDAISINTVETKKILLFIQENNKNTDQAIKKLMKLRYPFTTEIDNKKKNFIEKSRWPNNVKVKFSRQGDKSGFEVTTFISKTDQTKIVLNHLETTIKSLETYIENEKPQGQQ